MKRCDFKRLLASKVKYRSLLVGAGTLTGLALASQLSSHVVARPRLSAYPFQLSVASGDPLPDGIVLWMRIAPKALYGSGIPQRNVSVRWEVATELEGRSLIGATLRLVM